MLLEHRPGLIADRQHAAVVGHQVVVAGGDRGARLQLAAILLHRRAIGGQHVRQPRVAVEEALDVAAQQLRRLPAHEPVPPRVELGFPDDDVEAVDELAVAALHPLVFGDAVAEHALQADDPEADLDPGAQLVGPERLGQVVVGAGGEALEHRLGAAPGGEHDDVDDALAERLARQAAQLEAVDARHVEVDDHDPDGEILEQGLPGEVAVGRGDHLVAPLLERALQDAQGQRVVVSRQDLHRRHQVVST